MEILSQSDINNLLDDIKKESILATITQISPSEIEEIKDASIKKTMKARFKIIHHIYVKPLEKLLIAFATKNNNATHYRYNLDSMSISSRLLLLRRHLSQYGVTYEQMASYVPQTQEDVTILSEAFGRGFTDVDYQTNDVRVQEARTFLQGNILEEIGQVSRK